MKKIITPVIITLLLIVGLLIYFKFITSLKNLPLVVLIFIAIVIIGSIVISIGVLVERINEIKKGELDDISKY